MVAAEDAAPKPIGKRLGTFGSFLVAILAGAVAWLISSFFK